MAETFYFEIIASDKKFYSGACEQVIFPAMDGLDQQKGRQPHQEARRKDPAVLRVQRRAQQPAHGHARRQHQRVHGGEDHRVAAALGKAHFPHVGSAFHHRDETVCASGAQQQHHQY